MLKSSPAPASLLLLNPISVGCLHALLSLSILSFLLLHPPTLHPPSLPRVAQLAKIKLLISCFSAVGYIDIIRLSVSRYRRVYVSFKSLNDNWLLISWAKLVPLNDEWNYFGIISWPYLCNQIIQVKWITNEVQYMLEGTNQKWVCTPLRVQGVYLRLLHEPIAGR